jgi:hypothetical protein
MDSPNMKFTMSVPSEVLEIDVRLAEPLIPTCERTNKNCTRACTREGSEEGRELAVASNNASVRVYYPSDSHVGAKIGASRTDIEAKLSNEGVDDVGAEEDSEYNSMIQQLRNISSWLQQHARQMNEAPRGQVDCTNETVLDTFVGTDMSHPTSFSPTRTLDGYLDGYLAQVRMRQKGARRERGVKQHSAYDL